MNRTDDPRLPHPPATDVVRPRAEAARTYDLLSRVYDATEGLFERRHQDRGLRALDARPGERVLEIGHGTGRCLAAIARSVGPQGRVVGIDISTGMRRVAAARLRRLGLAHRVELRTGDVLSLPVERGGFDAVFSTFCLELFATAELPQVLGRCRGALRPGGRLVVVSLVSTPLPGIVERGYLWAHQRFPRVADCRPIPVEALVESAGFESVQSWRMPLLGLPVAVVRAARGVRSPEP